MLVVQLILIIWKIFHYMVHQLPINIYLVEILILTCICLAGLLARMCFINKDLTQSETLALRYQLKEINKNKKLTQQVSELTKEVEELTDVIITLDYSQMEKQNKELTEQVNVSNQKVVTLTEEVSILTESVSKMLKRATYWYELWDKETQQNKELTEQVNVSNQKVIALTEELNAKNVEITNNNTNFHYWCNKYISEDMKNKSLSQDVITLNEKVITLTEEVERLKYELEEMNPPTLNMCLNSLNEANEIIARMNERNNIIEREEADKEESKKRRICNLKRLKDEGVVLGQVALKFLSDNDN
jgi:uncharacterized protein YoxC